MVAYLGRDQAPEKVRLESIRSMKSFATSFTSSTAFPSMENNFRKNWLRISGEIRLQKRQDKIQSAAQTHYQPADMASHLTIKPFKGPADGSEDPDEFLDDI